MGVGQIRVREVFGDVPRGDVSVDLAPLIVVADIVNQFGLAPSNHLAHTAR